MDNLFTNFSIQDNALIDKIEVLLNDNDFIQALNMINNRLDTIESDSVTYKNILIVKLGLLMIDIGCEGGIESAIKKGIDIINKNLRFFNNGDFHYNMGNAFDGLFLLNKTRECEFQIPHNIEDLILAKDHYWESMQFYLDENIQLPLELKLNLANILSRSNRLTEGLRLYDEILNIDSKFPQALINRSKYLLTLSYLTGSCSLNMLCQSLKGFIDISNNLNLPLHYTHYSEYMIKHIREMLLKLNYNFDTIEQEMKDVHNDTIEQTKYQQYCANKKLILNEHSLYCNCTNAMKDDLVISRMTLRGDFIPSMELVLNRIKSEFVFARWLYFNAIFSEEKIKTKIDIEVEYVELFENEFIGFKSEMLRTSFRICFGILDRIATAICKLYHISGENEDIAFHDFWKKKSKINRWKEITNINNPFILSLYTIATDLGKNGKLNNYKKWRNDIEHNMLLLTFRPEVTGPFIKDNRFSSLFEFIDANIFIRSLEHLLQIATSAIFSFAFAVRYEGNTGSNSDSNHDQINSLSLYPKNDRGNYTSFPR